jgi:hypothetical protein
MNSPALFEIAGGYRLLPDSIQQPLIAASRKSGFKTPRPERPKKGRQPHRCRSAAHNPHFASRQERLVVASGRRRARERYTYPTDSRLRKAGLKIQKREASRTPVRSGLAARLAQRPERGVRLCTRRQVPSSCRYRSPCGDAAGAGADFGHFLHPFNICPTKLALSILLAHRFHSINRIFDRLSDLS